MRPMNLARNDSMCLKGTLFVLLTEGVAKDAATLSDALELLSEPRFACTHVSRPEQALACLDMASFDAVVLDGRLAEGPGEEILRQIRGRDEHLVIVLLAGPGGKTSFADELALQPYAILTRERILQAPNFFPGFLRHVISKARAQARIAESLNTPPERRYKGRTRRVADRRQGQVDLSQALQNVERCLLAGPCSGGLEAWVAELQVISDAAAPLMERQFGRGVQTPREEIPYGADQRPSQLQAMRRYGRALLADYGQFHELVINATSEICGPYRETPDFNRISGTLSKRGLSLILECRRHEANLAASIQESAYWEDGGGG